MKVIQIGNGRVSAMHRNCFPEGIVVIAAIDTNPKNQGEEFPVFPDINSIPRGLLGEADLWDICVPDEYHLPAIKEVLARGAQKILVEKPICIPSQIEEMEALLTGLSGIEVCVEETYASSKVVKVVREQSEKCGILRPQILIEQSKNRMEDITKGRFIDRELGVFGLEIPHSLTVVVGTGNKRLPSIIQHVSLEDMRLPSGQILPRQGKGAISYLTEDGCQVKMVSAMNGEVLHPLPELNAPTVIPFGSPVRYRVLVLEEKEYRIIGQFEPIPDWPRFRGRVLVLKSGECLETIEVEDKPMNEHIARAIRYFKGEEENPAPATKALSLVKFLGEVMARLKS